MKNTPSALKWLAEKRARLAGELLSSEQLIPYLEGSLSDLRKQVEISESALALALVRKARLVKELASMDEVVQMYDKGINPALIQPINAWQGNYGKRGALRGFLMETLQKRAPEYLSTKKLELLTTTHFALVFEHAAMRKQWYDGSFRNTIKVLAKQGYIERSHRADVITGDVGSWRWKQEQPKTLEALKTQATSTA